MFRIIHKHTSEAVPQDAFQKRLLGRQERIARRLEREVFYRELDAWRKSSNLSMSGSLSRWRVIKRTQAKIELLEKAAASDGSAAANAILLKGDMERVTSATKVSTDIVFEAADYIVEKYGAIYAGIRKHVEKMFAIGLGMAMASTMPIMALTCARPDLIKPTGPQQKIETMGGLLHKILEGLTKMPTFHFIDSRMSVATNLGTWACVVLEITACVLLAKYGMLRNRLDETMHLIDTAHMANMMKKAKEN